MITIPDIIVIVSSLVLVGLVGAGAVIMLTFNIAAIIPGLVLVVLVLLLSTFGSVAIAILACVLGGLITLGGLVTLVSLGSMSRSAIFIIATGLANLLFGLVALTYLRRGRSSEPNITTSNGRHNLPPPVDDLTVIREELFDTFLQCLGWIGTTIRSLSALNKTALHFKRLLRPKVPLGHRRLEWICECGTLLWGDFDNSDSEQIEQLYQELVQNMVAHVIPLSQFPKQRPSSGSISSATSTPNSSQPSLVNILSSVNTGTNLARPSQQSSSTASSRAPQATLSTSSSTNSTPAQDPIRKYFAVCANTGDQLVHLGESNVSYITRDSDFFYKIWSQYEALRGFDKFRELLIKPVDVKFVQFTLEDHHRVDISYDPPHIPPEKEVRSGNYEYTPCPLPTKIKQPIPASTFLHYCKDHKSIHSTIWTKRLPKKLKQRLLERRIATPEIEYVTGWGVYIIEGPNWREISWLGAMVCTLSVMTAVVYSVVRKDPSSGFTIGAFMVSLWIAWTTAFYYQWKET